MGKIHLPGTSLRLLRRQVPASPQAVVFHVSTRSSYTVKQLCAVDIGFSRSRVQVASVPFPGLRSLVCFVFPKQEGCIITKIGKCIRHVLNQTKYLQQDLRGKTGCKRKSSQLRRWCCCPRCIICQNIYWRGRRNPRIKKLSSLHLHSFSSISLSHISLSEASRPVVPQPEKLPHSSQYISAQITETLLRGTILAKWLLGRRILKRNVICCPGIFVKCQRHMLR